MDQDDDRLLARICLIWPSVPPVKRPEREADDEMANRAFDRQCRLEMRNDASEAPAPTVVPLSGAAAIRVEEYYQSLRSGEDGHGGLLKSFTGKTPGMVVRIALILALLEWAVGDDDALPAEIGTEYVEHALGFVSGYLVPMARRAYVEAAIPPDERGARTLGSKIVTCGLTKLTKDDVRSMQLEGLRKSGDITAALQALVEGNILVECKAETGKPGRPRLAYEVNPRVWG